MKNIILACIGSCALLYLSVLGLLIYNHQIRKNELDKTVSSVAKSTLLEYYKPWECANENQREMMQKEATERLQEEIQRRCATNADRKVETKILDLEKGIVSVEVEECYSLPGGNSKQIQLQKTILMDRIEEETTWVHVSFWEGEHCLKEYQAKPGDELPVPKILGRNISTWRDVKSDKIYHNQDKIEVGTEDIRISAVGVGK